MTPRRKFSAAFKARVALGALPDDKTIQEIASKHKVHPNRVSIWKRQAMDGLDEVFSNGADPARRDRPGLSLGRQCGLLSISRSSFYYVLKGEISENLALMRRIDALFLKCPFYGSRQMVWQLWREGIRFGRHRVRRLMRLQAIYQAPRTGDPHPEHRIYLYPLRNMEVTRPNQVWCADITYIPVQRGFLYLVAIMDWTTRHVLSWRLSNAMDASFCVEALNEALPKYGKPEMFNTDQGSQFTSFAFNGVLKSAEITISMDGRGRCGQHLHRAALALTQVRGHLPARTERWLQGRPGDRRMDRLLQRRAAPFVPWRTNTGGSLRRNVACGNDG